MNRVSKASAVKERSIKKFILLMVLGICGCTGLPEGIEPLDNVDLDRYLGTWYEIARLDHGFERGLSRVTANYSIREDGGIRVLNRGYSEKTGKWDEAEGKAYFVEDEDVGHLKVSFFGPFYGSYVIYCLDRENYDYACVTGPNRDYLWLLSRTPEVDEGVMNAFLDQAEELGFEMDELILVDQSPL